MVTVTVRHAPIDGAVTPDRALVRDTTSGLACSFAGGVDEHVHKVTCQYSCLYIPELRLYLAQVLQQCCSKLTVLVSLALLVSAALTVLRHGSLAIALPRKEVSLS